MYGETLDEGGGRGPGRTLQPGGRKVLWVDCYTTVSTESEARALEQRLLAGTAEHGLGQRVLPEGWTESREIRAVGEIETVFRSVCKAAGRAARFLGAGEKRPA